MNNLLVPQEVLLKDTKRGFRIGLQRQTAIMQN